MGAAASVVVRRLVVPPLDANCYIVACPQTHRAAVIDPGGDAPRILATLTGANLEAKAILLTHGHFDHMTAAAELQEATGAPAYAHPGDHGLLLRPSSGVAACLGIQIRPLTSVRPLHDGDSLTIGTLTVTVLATPGHSPGSVCFLVGDAVFTGDTLFAGGIGRTDLSGGDPAALLQSLRDRLLTLPPATTVYPGHGLSTTIANERRSNPFVS